MNAWPKLIGVWILSDAIYSSSLYTYHKKIPQTWLVDHWVRALRAILGLILIIWG